MEGPASASRNVVLKSKQVSCWESLSIRFSSSTYMDGGAPFEGLVRKLGIGYRTRGTGNLEDLGGYQPAAPTNPPHAGAWCAHRSAVCGLRLTHVFSEGAAQSAGLSAGDILVAIDGERVSVSNLGDLLNRAAGQAVECIISIVTD